MRKGQPRVEHPEIHARALAQMVPLGRIKTGHELGFRSNHKLIWDACPVCGLRRWVLLKKRGVWCRRCVCRRASRCNRLRECSPQIVARQRLLYALGRAAERAGLTVEMIEAMGRGGRGDQAGG